MSSKIDNDGRPWALVSEVEEGCILEADSGFVCDELDGGVWNEEHKDCFCIEPGSRLQVFKDEDGDLYVPCSNGCHSLEGQFEEDEDGTEFYIGLYKL